MSNHDCISTVCQLHILYLAKCEHLYGNITQLSQSEIRDVYNIAHLTCVYIIILMLHAIGGKLHIL